MQHGWVRRRGAASILATLTNIIAYCLSFCQGNTGSFLGVSPRDDEALHVARSLRDIIPAAGYYIQRQPKRKERATVEEKRQRGFYGFTNRWLSGHSARGGVGRSFLFLLIGGPNGFRTLKQQFFPEDIQYCFTSNIWHGRTSALTATNDA